MAAALDLALVTFLQEFMDDDNRHEEELIPVIIVLYFNRHLSLPKIHNYAEEIVSTCRYFLIGSRVRHQCIHITHTRTRYFVSTL